MPSSRAEDVHGGDGGGAIVQGETLLVLQIPGVLHRVDPVAPPLCLALRIYLAFAAAKCVKTLHYGHEIVPRDPRSTNLCIERDWIVPTSPVERVSGSTSSLFYHGWWKSSAWICHTVSKLPPEIVQFHRATGFRSCSALCGVSSSARIWSATGSCPLAGEFLSVAMVGVGLLPSAKGAPEGTLVQVPSVVFQGSFLLGLVARAALGYDASAGNSWLVWTNDDGFQLASSGMYRRRKIQAAFGSKVLNITGLITYVLLGLGVLGGPLSLPWGLYIIIVQRSSEKACLNDVTGVGTWRQIVYAVALVLVVLTLLPLWDGLATQLGIGIGTPDSLDLFM
ncbi:probable zinc metalloprotease EGY1, chloroplastic [Selaginella moellendorffii]|uniref:probable zinc metalloprotease EGY1, chloroplastic n=1 Tax=Selaginella moellendorffii TaxID=88036 RepID=UPI000D1CBFF5|nr:probable zinc metalloprotease EGY1, chloroplastic [Selaginella moellendorffii]|eukprot:XP_024541828.1 probable zinc metalloprotease EGY1, chloroplastic [Selaginella moellendorffii]